MCQYLFLSVWKRLGHPVSFAYFKNYQFCRKLLKTYYFPSNLNRQPLANLIYRQNYRTIHTSKICSAPILPFLLMIFKPISKGLAIITGRGIRKWWRSLPPNKKVYFMDVAKRNKIKITGVMILTSGICVIYYYSHLQEAPITRRKRFLAFTPEQFKRIGEFHFKLQLELNKEELLPPKHPLCQRVVNVTNQILNGNTDIESIKNKNWIIYVIKNETQNAFVLPNGQIFVFTGMLSVCDNNDQLGTILAHEIAHCILEHAAETFSFGHLLDVTLIVVLAAVWCIMPMDSIAMLIHWFFNKVIEILLELPYSRKLEMEADEVGLILAAKACLDVRESSAFWSKISVLNKYIQNEPDIKWLSTHPSNEARSSYLDGMMDKALELRKIHNCPCLTKTDPRSKISTFRKIVEEEIKRKNAENIRYKELITVPIQSGKN